MKNSSIDVIKRRIEEALYDEDKEKFLEAYSEFLDLIYSPEFPFSEKEIGYEKRVDGAAKKLGWYKTEEELTDLLESVATSKRVYERQLNIFKTKIEKDIKSLKPKHLAEIYLQLLDEMASKDVHERDYVDAKISFFERKAKEAHKWDKIALILPTLEEEIRREEAERESRIIEAETRRAKRDIPKTIREEIYEAKIQRLSTEAEKLRSTTIAKCIKCGVSIYGLEPHFYSYDEEVYYCERCAIGEGLIFSEGIEGD